MKKIIATVLAMVMALALCTTAFAANKTVKADLYLEDGKAYCVGEDAVVLEFHKASKTEKNIAYWTVDEFDGDFKYVEVAAKDAEYIVKNAGSKNVYMYLAEVEDVEYEYVGAKYTNLGKGCGQFDASKMDDDLTFYTYTNGDDQTILACDGEDFALLVDGEIVMAADVDEDGATLADLVNAHTWTLDTKNMTAKCSKDGCTATGKLYTNPAENKDSTLTVVKVFEGKDAYYVAYNGTLQTTKPTTTTTAGSPKTFDAGVAMYAGMALMSVAGSAVVIGKKKEF